MAEALAVSTLASCAVTELIRKVITCLHSAKRCKSECMKLEKELKIIEPDVEKIEKRLGFLQGACNGHHCEDLKMVKDWLGRLKDAIQLANIEVRKCNSGSRLLNFDSKLSKRITSMYENITKAADNRLGYFLQLNSLFIPEETRPDPWYKSPGEAILLRMTEERNESLRREDLTRLSMSSSSSHNGRYGSPIFSQDSGSHSSESSSFYGEESSVHESSESPHLRLMTQQRNEILRREDRTRSSPLGHSHQM